MVKSKLDYPHPVLMINGDDYDKECAFSVTMAGEVQEDDYDVCFSLEYNLHCECLNKLINEEKARVVVYIESPNSSFRKMILFPENEASVKVEVKKDMALPLFYGTPYLFLLQLLRSPHFQETKSFF